MGKPAAWVRANVGMDELVEWREFEDGFGPLTLHERIDALIQAQTGEPVKWQVRRPMTDEGVRGFLHALAGGG